jgi:exo-beta-1,3-glucanase (GH17 family)
MKDFLGKLIRFSFLSTAVLILGRMACSQNASPISGSQTPKLERLQQAFREDHFVAYTPSEYNPLPNEKKRATAESIRADLEVLKPFFNALVTYSCSANEGVDQIVPVAAELGFHVILGIWDVRSVREIETAVRLARTYPDTVLAIIVGNETLLFRRADWEELAAAIRLVQTALPGIPVSTTEPITEYGDEDLRRIVDFHAPNCHWVFQGGDRQDVQAAVSWLKERIEALQGLPFGDKPVLIKEQGVPSGPAPFTPELQAEYWAAWLKTMPNTERCASAFWEAFDLVWKPKTNPSDLSEMEAHWGGWDQIRRPKPVVNVLPQW